ncbi:hypothetical protein BIY28_07695 [Brenneria goodwinii]|nr:hypothetical protein BIY28_07695 [Brenneria goodwinii]
MSQFCLSSAAALRLRGDQPAGQVPFINARSSQRLPFANWQVPTLAPFNCLDNAIVPPINEQLASAGESLFSSTVGLPLLNEGSC